ncbi:uncharacterized protein [Acropora muricata]|uniref:uncharacterized protein n=1 Tax=Acropora muricata TaxID=159855 RepID=UPI0034E5FEE6
MDTLSFQLNSKQGFHETKYLVKWEGYSSFENTWDPEEHLSPLLLRVTWHTGVPQAQRITMEFIHDVFKYLFHSKGRKSPDENWTLYEQGDFSKCQIPNQWNCVFDKHGDGYRM